MAVTLADEQLDVLVTCNTDELERAEAVMAALERRAKQGINTKMNVDLNGLNKGETVLGNLSNKARSAQRFLQGVSSSLNVISATLQNIGNNMQMVGRFGLIASTIAGGAAIGGLAKLTTTGVKAASTLENVQQQILAQGVDEQKAAQVLNYIRDYANRSAFGVSNLGSAISDVNSYIGDIDKSTRVVEVFGTSLMATGKSASDLARVAPNLGQLATDAFGKTDYKELVRGVPAIAQALRDLDIQSWEDFNEALGDNPNTKEIERTGNALDLVTEALDRYNIKTDAFARSQESLSARLENTQGVIEDSLGQAVQESGLYDKLGIMLENVAEGFEKNIPLITTFYGWLGDMGVRLSEFLRDFDFAEFGKGFRNAISDITEGVTNFIDKNKRTFNQIKDFFTDGMEGAEGLGNAIGNIFGTSAKLYFGGTLVKALSSVISLVSTGAGLAANFAGGLSGIFSGADKFSRKRNTGLNGLPVNTKNTGISTPDSYGYEGILGEFATTKVQKAVQGNTKRAGNFFSNLLPVRTISGWFKKSTDTMQTGFKGGVSRIGGVMNNVASSTGRVIATGASKVKGVASGALRGLGKAGRAVGGAVTKSLSFVAENFLGIGTDVYLITQAVKQFDELPSASVVASGFAKIAGVMSGMSLLNGIIGKVSNFLGVNQAMGALSNALNAGSIFLIAKSMDALNDLPDADTILQGFTKISLFAAGAAGLNLLQGGIATATGGLTAIAQVIGAFTNTINAGSMVVLARSLKSLEDLPEENVITDGLEKLKTVSIELATISGLSAVLNLGGLTSLLGNFAAWNNAGIVKNVLKAAESLEEIGSIIIPENTSEKVEQIIVQMQSIRDSFSGLDAFGDWFAKWDSSILTKMTENISRAGDALEEISGISVPTNIGEKIEQITDAMKSIRDFFEGGFSEIFGSLGDKWESGNISKAVENVATAGRELEAIQDIDLSKISSKSDNTIENITNAMNAVADGFSDDFFVGLTTKWDSGTITEIVKNVGDAARAIDGLNDIEIPTNVKYEEIISNIDTVVSSISDIEIPSAAEFDSQNLSTIIESFSSSAKDIGKLNDIEVPNASKIESLSASLEAVMTAMRDITGIEGDDPVSKAQTKQIESLNAISEEMAGIVDQVSNIASSLSDIQGIALDANAIAANVKTTLSTMVTTINSLKDVFAGSTSAGGTSILSSSGVSEGGLISASAEQLAALDELVEAVGQIASKLSSLSGTLEDLQKGQVNVELIRSQLEQLKGSLSSLYSFMVGGMITEGGTGGDPLAVFGDRFEESGDDYFSNIIQKIKDTGEKLKELQTTLVDIQNAQVVAEQMKSAMTALIDSLNEILASLTSEAFNSAVEGVSSEGITNAINSIQTFVDNVTTAIEGLNNLAPVGQTAGTNISAAVVAGFLATDLSPMLTHVQTTLQSIAEAGTTYGQNLSNNFNSATASLGETAIQRAGLVTAALRAIPTEINVSVNVTSNVGDIAGQLSALQRQASSTVISPRTAFALGGFVDRVARFAKGGIVGNRVFQSASKGTDKIPAMLTQGEFVQQRKAVAFWGRGVMEAMNQRNVSGVSRMLQGKINSTSKVVNNNINNTNKPTIHQTFYGGDSSNYNRLNRIVRGV